MWHSWQFLPLSCMATAALQKITMSVYKDDDASFSTQCISTQQTCCFYSQLIYNDEQMKFLMIEFHFWMSTSLLNQLSGSSYHAFCLIGQRCPTRIRCWKMMAMMPLMASSSCPASSGMAPPISRHQTRRLRKPVRDLNKAASFLSHCFSFSCSCSVLHLRHQ